MALSEAMQEIARDWDRIRPRLSDEVLGTVTRLAAEPNDATAEQLFALISTHLADDHPAWEALRTGKTRRIGDPTGGDLRIDVLAQIHRQASNALLRSVAIFLDPANTYERDDADRALYEGVKATILEGDARIFADLWDRDLPAGLRGIETPAGTAYPSFQFLDGSDLPRPAFVAISATLGADDDPIGALSWWTTPNAWLDFETPASMLMTGRDSEAAFAADQLMNDNW